MADQEFNSAGQGITTAAGIDWNVKNCDLTVEINEVETTNTSNWDPTDKVLYSDAVGTKRKASGTFEADWDDNNEPLPTLFPGAIVPLTVAFPNGKHFACSKVLITSVPIKIPVSDGIYNYSIAWRSKGKFTYG